MATSNLFSHLRRARSSSSFYLLSSPSLALSQVAQPHLNSDALRLSSSPSTRILHSRTLDSFFYPGIKSPAAINFLSSRSFSTRSDDDFEFEQAGCFGVGSGTESAFELGNESGLGYVGFREVSEGLIDSTTGEELIIPVKALISMLDGFHEFTGLPWWAVIISSTLALRLTLLPLLIVQLQKLKRIGELFPKLPPPLPPPISGRSYLDQISLFRKERKALGCPSFLWFLASLSVQVPCFLMWMVSIRRMSLDHHPGFDCGGALWFQNLTEYPHGIMGPVFPFLIAGLHYTNVQISFRTSSVGKANDLFSLLAKFYKLYLDLLTLPIFFIGYCIPQGSLVYWVTNSSLSVTQQLFLKNPAVRTKLGLPTPAAASTSERTVSPGMTSMDSPTKGRKISIENLSSRELLALSVQLLSKGHKERAIILLRQALAKEPEYIRALIVMGQTLLQNGQLVEAVEHLEHAISKLFLAGPTEVEDVDLLILASQWAGVAYIRQEKRVEGIVHLERIARLKEPEEPKSKAHYFDGLVLLASALFNENRKAEAVKYLRLAAAYNPAYKEYLEQCVSDDDNFVSDLSRSRRRDY